LAAGTVVTVIEWPDGRHSGRRLEDQVKTFAALLSVSMVALASTAFAITPNDVTSGSLLLKAKDGAYLEAPRLGADYNVTISGPTGRTVLTQRFENPADGWVEGVYAFPLPEGAAVDTLKIIAGSRVIVGEVKEKQDAKVIYETAKNAGQTASLQSPISDPMKR
jgi:Ca-activated chloride channel homolog